MYDLMIINQYYYCQGIGLPWLNTTHCDRGLDSCPPALAGHPINPTDGTMQLYVKHNDNVSGNASPASNGNPVM